MAANYDTPLEKERRRRASTPVNFLDPLRFS